MIRHRKSCLVLNPYDTVDMGPCGTAIKVESCYLEHAISHFGPWSRHRKGTKQKRFVRVMIKMVPVR